MSITGKKAIWGWALYDWANSAFATTVMAGFFPIFFKEYWSAGANINLSTARLGFANAAAGLLVALMAPVMGAIADAAGARKRFLIGFAYLGVLMTAGLFMVGKGQWIWAVCIYVLGTIGFSGANVFYDALLPSVAGVQRLERVSSFGYAMGYLGGGLLFLINVLMMTLPHRFGLADAGQAVRFSFLSVALWWGGFTVFTLYWVPEEKLTDNRAGVRKAVVEGLKRFFSIFRRIRTSKAVWLFLLAYWFYIDGVDTIVRMAVDYGLSLGFPRNDLILALLIVQFVGFPAALIFGRLGEKWGVRKSIYLALFIYVLITAWGVGMTSSVDFYLLAVMIGLVQGGIQALSRSYYSRLIPADQPALYFGFYNLLGKFAVILGPALMGAAGLIARRLLLPPTTDPEVIAQGARLASRWGIGSIVILFVIGGILFYVAGREDKTHPLPGDLTS
ncbi:MAG: MFS transporter [Deltaproteobacteria bacterium]|nr:MFS transporter [Deltaproteobacteria bacterium]